MGRDCDYSKLRSKNTQAVVRIFRIVYPLDRKNFLDLHIVKLTAVQYDPTHLRHHLSPNPAGPSDTSKLYHQANTNAAGGRGLTRAARRGRR